MSDPVLDRLDAYLDELARIRETNEDAEDRELAEQTNDKAAAQ